MQETWVWSLAWEDPIWYETWAPQLPSLCSRPWEPHLLTLHAANAEARMPQDHDLQQEGPLPHNEEPAQQKKKKNYLNKWCNGWNLRGEYKIPLCIMVIVTLPQSREMKALKKHYFFILLINSLKKKLWYLTIPLHLSVRQVSSKDYDSRDI